MAWRVSARVRRWRGASAPAYGGWREAPCGEAAMHRSKHGEPTSEHKLARLAAAQSAPPWAVT